MSALWGLYNRFRRCTPQPVVKGLRKLLERYSDRFWQRQYYGQFAEDAVLDSLLRRIEWERRSLLGEQVTNPEAPTGFYVDVGAFSPKQFSNTYYFYKKGWRGINVDATPGSMEIFRSVRKRDINVEAAVSDRTEPLKFHFWGVPAGNNTLSAEHREEYAKFFGPPKKTITVSPVSLMQLLDQHLPANQPIDFMSVDVEGHCLNVLRSNDWNKYRPRFLWVEVDHETANIEEILRSEMCQFMLSQDYAVSAWIGVTVLFKDQRNA